MDKITNLEDLMNIWEATHKSQGYQRFIRDGIVCQEQWVSQSTPKVCFFLKEARTSNEAGYNLTKDLKESPPWRMWKKVAIWTQAVHDAFQGKVEYNNERLRSNEKAAINSIAVVNVKKSNGNSSSDYNDLEKYTKDDRAKLKRELELINPDVIICGNNFSLLKKFVLKGELSCDNTEDNMIAMWKNTLIIDYYHPAVQYPNRVNYYALASICRTAIEKYGFSVTGNS